MRAKGARDGELNQSLYELAVREQWKLLELKAEEGRLDEVFRNITIPETPAATKEETR